MTKQKKSIYKVPLVNRKFFAIVDRDRKKDVKKHNWKALFIRKLGVYYPYTKINGKIVKLHNYVTNFKPTNELSIDHINRNPLDATSANLRIATRSVQCINQKIGKKNTTGVKGLSFDTKRRIIMVYWRDDNMAFQFKLFYYRNMTELRSAFINGFILRKNKEREIEKYRIALCLDSIPYDKLNESKTEPLKAFNEFIEKNKNVDFNFKINNNEVDLSLLSKDSIWRINQTIYKTNKSGIIGVYLRKNRRLWVASWQEEEKQKEKSFSYKNEKDFRLAFIKAFIFRKNKERELEHYRISLNLDNTPYDQLNKSKTEPGQVFDAFMEKNKGEDFNFVKK